MTKERALSLLGDYGRYVVHVKWGMFDNLNPAQWEALIDVQDVRERFPAGGSERKAMRWLGWTQGVLQACGVFTLEELKEHSRTGQLG